MTNKSYESFQFFSKYLPAAYDEVPICSIIVRGKHFTYAFWKIFKSSKISNFIVSVGRAMSRLISEVEFWAKLNQSWTYKQRLEQ